MLSTKQADNPGAFDNESIVVQLQTYLTMLFFMILELEVSKPHFFYPAGSVKLCYREILRKG